MSLFRNTRTDGTLSLRRAFWSYGVLFLIGVMTLPFLLHILNEYQEVEGDDLGAFAVYLLPYHMVVCALIALAWLGQVWVARKRAPQPIYGYIALAVVLFSLCGAVYMAASASEALWQAMK